MKSAQQRGLDRNVDYLGPCNLNEIVEAIEDCDLGISPNHRNIFTEINTPTRIFEYLALAKPVIAPKAKDIQDYFGDNDMIFFKLGDADDLARKSHSPILIRVMWPKQSSAARQFTSHIRGAVSGSPY